MPMEGVGIHFYPGIFMNAVRKSLGSQVRTTRKREDLQITPALWVSPESQ
jgi:hypothetical protein